MPLTLCVVLALAGGVPAQIEEDLTGSLDEYRNILALADAAFENLELSEALPLYSQVIDGYKTGRLQASTPLTRRMVGKSYEGRAMTLANLGRWAEAETDFEALVRFDVGWSLDRKTISPKIITLFDEVRKKTLGVIAIKTEPPGASVSLNGEMIGVSPVFDRELPAGGYLLEVRAPGFETLGEQVLLEGGQRVEKDLKLVPNARGVLITTTPAGVRVSVDGKERGSTFGAAGADYADVAASLGLTPADLSSPLLIDHLEPGQHVLKLEKDCHESRTFTLRVELDPNDNSPVRFEPMPLDPSRGSLRIESTPPGAAVEVDGRPSGSAPLTLGDLCAGPHEVVIRGKEVGQWRGTVDVFRNQVVRVDGSLRRTIAVVGLDGPADGGRLVEALSALGRFNVILHPQKLPSTQDERLSVATVSDIAGKTGADLVLVTRRTGSAFEETLDIVLHAARYPELTDRVVLPVEDEAGIEEFTGMLSSSMQLNRPWLGLRTIEIYRGVNPIVIRVQPGSPAAEAGVRPGERVVSIGSHPLGKPSDLDQAVAAMEAGEEVLLTLQSPGQNPRQLKVTIGSTAIIRPVLPEGTPMAYLAADLSFRARMEKARGNPDGTIRNAALLNLALLLMREGLYNAALRDALDPSNLPAGPGISSGTLDFIKGLCLEGLKRPDDARARYQMAATQMEATLWTNDGPPVSERALRRLGSL